MNASDLNLKPDWSQVVCVASGPSFSEAQAALIEQAHRDNLCRVIVVNDNYKRVPNADLLYAPDGTWWEKHINTVKAGFSGVSLTSDTVAAARHGLLCIAMDSKGVGLSREGAINIGGNSGYASIDIACRLGAKRILLVGYDMQRTDGKTHWFGEHPDGLWNYHPDNMIAAWAKRYAPLAGDLLRAGVQCINCTIDTALDCFVRSTLEEELYGHAASA